MESSSESPRKRIGVVPPSAAAKRACLLGSLGSAFRVDFEARSPDDLSDVDGVLVVLAREEGSSSASELTRIDRPCLTVHLGEQVRAQPPATVEFADDADLAAVLRGRRLSEEFPARAATACPGVSDRVLARVAGEPAWWIAADAPSWSQHTCVCPEELRPGEALRDRLRPGHAIGLLPWLHLLSEVCGRRPWDCTPLRAAFVIDDPNLHSGSYGHLDYRELIAHAREHDYHAALATVPLDGWTFSASTARLVRDNSQWLSLLMHGNDHVAAELGRLSDDLTAETVLAQALRRIAALERRSGVPIDRVMAPPHELCSASALKAMFRLGFDAACIGRRHPWREHGALPPVASSPLLKWHPTDMIDGGLPILPRHPIEQSSEELLLRSLLGQPLVVFAHHWDVADGLDGLAQVAEGINGLGEVRWQSVGSIAAACYSIERTDETLNVLMHSRRCTVGIPSGVRSVRVLTPSLIEDEPDRLLVCNGQSLSVERSGGYWRSERLPVSTAGSFELALASGRPLDPANVPRPPRRPWPIARRLLVEGRDRARPLLRR